MDKLELNLDDLEVDSFTTAPEQGEAGGTVRGNDPEPFPPPPTFYDGDTCGLSCGGTCGNQTCANTCNPYPTIQNCGSEEICLV